MLKIFIFYDVNETSWPYRHWDLYNFNIKQIKISENFLTYFSHILAKKMNKWCSICGKKSETHSKRIIRISCLGHCRLVRETFSLYKFYSKAKDTVDIQISNLVVTESTEHITDDSQSLCSNRGVNLKPNAESNRKSSKFLRLKTIFSKIKNKNYDKSTLRLELLDDEWSLTEGETSAKTEDLGISLSAKMKKEISHNSVSVNSLDLEWEHLPEMVVFSSNVEKEEPQSATSVGGWSRLSSADSLEWDPAEVEIKEELDTETEQLLQEIEMLSSKTLQETQEWAS